MKYLYLTEDKGFEFAFFSSDNLIYNITVYDKMYKLFFHNLNLAGHRLKIINDSCFIFENKKYIKTNIKSNYSYPMYELVENSLKRRIKLTKE